MSALSDRSEDAQSKLPLLASILVGLGVLFRLHHLTTLRSLRLDEAALAVELIRRDYWDILFGWSYNTHIPTAPIGFLSVSKFFLHSSHGHELALRFLPFVISLITLYVVLKQTVRLFSPTLAQITAIMLALSTPVIFFAADLKQYSTDIFFTTILLFATIHFQRHREGLRSLLAYGALGVIALIFSFTAVFMLFSCGLVLILKAWRDRDKSLGIRSALVGIFWAMIFIGIFSNSAGLVMSNDQLFQMYEGTYLRDVMASPLLSAQMLLKLIPANFGIVWMPLSVTACVLMMLGAAKLIQEDWFKGLLIVVPLILVIAASLAGRYPFFDRFLIFLVPCTALMLARGCIAVASVSHTRQWAKGLVVLLLISQPLWNNLAHVRDGYNPEHTRPVMRYLFDHYQSGDAIYLNNAATNAFLFYQYQQKHRPKLKQIGRIMDYHRSGIVDVIREEHVYDGPVFLGIDIPRDDRPREYELDASYWAAMEDAPRVWVIFSYGKPDTDQFTLASMEPVYVLKDQVRHRDTFLYMLERRESPSRR